jgi:glucose-1-phosphatase
MTELKNIIFDLGGVLINLDFSKTTHAFNDMGFPNFDHMFSQFKADQLFEKLETGMVSVDDFYTVMLKIGNENITKDLVKNAWNSLLLDFREESLAFLEELKENYNLYLLSNTNKIHYDAFNDILMRQTGHENLDHFFRKCYYSHEMGLRKPNEDIFDFVLSDAGISAGETLFIDDTINNITTAQKMGFKTHHLLPGEKIESIQYQ